MVESRILRSTISGALFEPKILEVRGLRHNRDPCNIARTRLRCATSRLLAAKSTYVGIFLLDVGSVSTNAETKRSTNHIGTSRLRSASIETVIAETRRIVPNYAATKRGT